MLANIDIIPIHQIAEQLGDQRCKSLLFSHAFTGCDQVSAFTGCGKRTAWKTWENSPSITSIFTQLADRPTVDTVQSNIKYLERFVCLMYCNTTTAVEVNKCRRELFVKKGRQMEGLPLTRAALIQHVYRAIYQAGYVWSQALKAMQVLPSPSEWGWKQLMSGEYMPIWSELQEVSIACRNLKKCGCNITKGCRVRCTFVVEHLSCAEMCNCNGDCERPDIN